MKRKASPTTNKEPQTKQIKLLDQTLQDFFLLPSDIIHTEILFYLSTVELIDFSSVSKACQRLVLDHMKQLAQSKNSHVKTIKQSRRIYLMDQDVDAEDLDFHMTYPSVHMVRCKLDNEGVRNLSQSLLGHGLLTLSLFNSGIGNEKLKLLTGGNFPELRKLILHGNSLTAKGMKYLAQSKFESLEYLDVSENKIKTEGALVLAKGCLEQFKQLKYLDLRKCGVVSKSVHTEFQKSPSLRTIVYTEKASQLSNKMQKMYQINALFKMAKHYGTLFKIAKWFEEAKFVSNHLATAVKWYKKSADLGCAEAMFNLAVMYSKGQGVEKDTEVGHEYYVESAENGHSEAQVYIGDVCKMRHQFKLAKQWYCKAAGEKNATAQYKLAKMYQHEDKEELALEWFRQAAENSHLKAQLKMMKLDEDNATHWRRLAAMNNHVPSMLKLGTDLTQSKLPDEANEGLEWLKKLAETEHAEGMFLYGRNLLDNNKEEGVKWLTKAKKAGYEVPLQFFMRSSKHK